MKPSSKIKIEITTDEGRFYIDRDGENNFRLWGWKLDMKESLATPIEIAKALLRNFDLTQNSREALMLENRDLRTALHRLLNSSIQCGYTTALGSTPVICTKPKGHEGNHGGNLREQFKHAPKLHGFPLCAKVYSQPGKVTLRVTDQEPPLAYDLPVEFFTAKEAIAFEAELSKAIRAAFPAAFGE